MSQVPDSFIIGTAGHIDHGKTTLVGALTGVDTDRLAEEKRRGITIVLGFAPLVLPSGRSVGVVDVPGHEKFVRTMVAGSGGVDLGLLVVSSEEGVMPQTREHLDVLALLGVPELVVALTRSDTVDPDLLELADLDVRELLQETPWAEAPVLPCSGTTGEGIPELLAALDEAAGRLPERGSSDALRLPVDRSFSVKGFGTVVTGTTRGGGLAGGVTLEVVPGGREVRTRGLQVHGHQADEVGRGVRVALNLQGVSSDEVPVGVWLAQPGVLAWGDRIDVEIRLLESAPRPLGNNDRVRFLCGTAEAIATVRLMDPDGGAAPTELLPGEVGLAQLALAESLGSVASDRFVLRAESPMVTIGGGTVLDPEPPLLRRRQRKAAAELLAVLRSPGSKEWERVASLLRRHPGEALDLRALQRRLPPSEIGAAAAAGEAVERGVVARLGVEPGAWIWTGVVQTWIDEVREMIVLHHREHPLVEGPQLSEVRQSLKPEPTARVFEALVGALCSQAGLERRHTRIALPDHRAQPDEATRDLLNRVVAVLASGGVHPPPLEVATAGVELPPDGLAWLVDQGEIVRVAEDYYVAQPAFRDLVRRLVRHIQGEGGGVLSPQAFKQISGLSRRHAIPFLEYLDRQRITTRTPEGRVTRQLPDWVERD